MSDPQARIVEYVALGTEIERIRDILDDALTGARPLPAGAAHASVIADNLRGQIYGLIECAEAEIHARRVGGIL